MEIRGRVHNGVVVLEGDLTLPEGTIVIVSYAESPTTIPPESGHRVELPLVKSDLPGSIDLTNDRIAELWAEDDLAAFGGSDQADLRQGKTEERRPKNEDGG